MNSNQINVSAVEYNEVEYDLCTQVVDEETTNWWLVRDGELVFADQYDVSEAETVADFDFYYLEVVGAIKAEPVCTAWDDYYERADFYYDLALDRELGL